jgi:hypothetical protein
MNDGNERKAEESHSLTDEGKLQMDGIVTTAVQLHLFRFGSYECTFFCT